MRLFRRKDRPATFAIDVLSNADKCILQIFADERCIATIGLEVIDAEKLAGCLLVAARAITR